MDETFEGRFAQAQLLWGNIAARPMRAFLSILAITIQVFLVLMIVGLTTGVVSEWGKRVEGVGADILVQPPNSSMFLAFSRAVLPGCRRSCSDADFDGPEKFCSGVWD